MPEYMLSAESNTQCGRFAHWLTPHRRVYYVMEESRNGNACTRDVIKRAARA